MIKYECMRKKIYTIEEIKEKAVPIAKSYGVNELSLFARIQEMSRMKIVMLTFLLMR